MSLISFTPSASVTVAPGTVPGVAVIPGTGHYLRFCNGGTGNAYVLFFEPSQATPPVNAAVAMLIPSGAIEIFSVASDHTQVAFLGDATGTTLNVTRGTGQ